MAILTEVTRQVEDILKTTGRSFLSLTFSRDFEVYFISLELTNIKGEMIDFFSFPVMVDSISKKEVYTSNIKKTFSGVRVIRGEAFTPQEIVLRGSFGRSFKILGGNELVDVFGSSARASISTEEDQLYNQGVLSNIVKTGYGCTKYLQGIIERSRIFDKFDGWGENSFPRLLKLYNHTLGEYYYVEPQQVQFEQNLGSNMIWNYNLVFTITRKVDFNEGTYKEKTSKLNNPVIKSAISSVVSSIGKSTVSEISDVMRRL